MKKELELANNAYADHKDLMDSIGDIAIEIRRLGRKKNKEVLKLIHYIAEAEMHADHLMQDFDDLFKTKVNITDKAPEGEIS